jgi:hypothetical protein
MAKKKENKSASTPISDVICFILALIYMQSVLTVAHHASRWVHDGTTHIVESPAVSVLVFGLLVMAYSFHKNRYKLSTVMVIALTIFATASIFWLSGLRTNFYL